MKERTFKRYAWPDTEYLVMEGGECIRAFATCDRLERWLKATEVQAKISDGSWRLKIWWRDRIKGGDPVRYEPVSSTLLFG